MEEYVLTFIYEGFPFESGYSSQTCPLDISADEEESDTEPPCSRSRLMLRYRVFSEGFARTFTSHLLENFSRVPDKFPAHCSPT